jgi:hypothetical protein
VIAVHLRAVLAGTKYAARVMAVQGTGSIINVASVNGFRAGLGGHYYSAAKAASIHLTRCAAMELGEKGIRVNSLSPGMIATGAFAKYVGMQSDEADDHPEYAEAAIGSVVTRWQPLQYVGRVDDRSGLNPSSSGAVVLHESLSDTFAVVLLYRLEVLGGIPCRDIEARCGWIPLTPTEITLDGLDLFTRKFEVLYIPKRFAIFGPAQIFDKRLIVPGDHAL